VNVTWTQAVEFCRALTEREQKAGRLPAGRVLRLPTEAEWEYACRAGTTTRHPAGDDPADLKPLASFAKTTAPFTRRDGPRFRSVGMKQPNAWGFHDMLGNVREWCSDWYAPLPGGAVTNWAGPAAPHQVKNETRAFRVARGGSWIDGERTVGSGARDWYGPEYGAAEGFREGTVGFRVAAAEEGPLR
jgi:formylglycine-generating enzyme required for sulfatase activity